MALIETERHSIAFVLTGDMDEETVAEIKETMSEDGLILENALTVQRDIDSLKEALFKLFMEDYDIIFTFGGIGMDIDDIVPEATVALIDKRLPGLEGAIMYALMEKGAYSILNRGICGLFRQTLVINLPGKKHIIHEVLNTIIPMLKQGIHKIRKNKA